MNFAHAERLPHDHTPLDNLANLDRGSLQEHGDNVWGVLQNIKDLDLSKVESGNLVYTDVMGLFVISWSEATSLTVSVVLVLLLVLIIVLLSKQQQLSIKQLLKGLLASVTILLCSVLVAMSIKYLAQILSASDAPWYSNQLPMQQALWFAVALFGLMVGRWFARKITTTIMLLAVTIFWTLLSAITSVMMPGISFLFIIPATAAVLSLFMFIYLVRASSSEQAKTKVHPLILIISGCVCAISFMPIAYVLEIMVGYQMSEAIGVMLGFITISLLPLLTMNSSAASGFKKLLYYFAIVALFGLGWTAYQPTYTKWMPQHLNLQYLQNPKGEAFVLKGHQKNQPSIALLNAFSTQTNLLAALPWSIWQFHSSKVDSELLETVKVDIQVLESSEFAKKVQLNLSALAANLSDLIIYVPSDSGLHSIKTGGEILYYLGENGGRSEYYQYNCRGISCAETQLVLNFSIDNPSNILIASFHAGLPTELAELSTLRGEKAVPYQNGDQSIVYTEVSF